MLASGGHLGRFDGCECSSTLHRSVNGHQVAGLKSNFHSARLGWTCLLYPPPSSCLARVGYLRARLRLHSCTLSRRCTGLLILSINPAPPGRFSVISTHIIMLVRRVLVSVSPLTLSSPLHLGVLFVTSPSVASSLVFCFLGKGLQRRGCRVPAFRAGAPGLAGQAPSEGF